MLKLKLKPGEWVRITDREGREAWFCVDRVRPNDVAVLFDDPTHVFGYEREKRLTTKEPV